MTSQGEQSAPSIADVKMQWRAEKRAKDQVRRDNRRWQRRCFWTRPIGHAWSYTYRRGYRTCEACNKEVFVD